jgi:hypothetical protein
MKNETIPSAPKDVKDNGILELQISKRIGTNREKRLGAFRFFTHQRFCFKQVDQNWQRANYDRALEICERIVTRAYNGQKELVVVRGSMLPHMLAKLGLEPTNPIEDSKLTALKSGQKITFMG